MDPMSTQEHLSKDQFTEVHRGVADWGAENDHGQRYSSAEDWHAAHTQERAGFGTWWGDEPTARFYGMGRDSGLVVSGRVPTHALTEVGHSTGYTVPPGTPVEVTRVRARAHDGSEVTLPHSPGMTIRA